jgi:REP element-mobilizing transposase RayT
MPIRTQITNASGVYFITITCCEWLPLIEDAQAYDYVYKWFDHLRSKGHSVVAYVIMPNHLHALIEFASGESRSINTIIGNGKRFLAYGIVDRLKATAKNERLRLLKSMVWPREKNAGKVHHVFEPSFDWKHCYGDDFILQKILYIHNNPIRKAWKLANDPVGYEHSSARYYATGEVGRCEIKDYRKLRERPE